jgi:hypothetical protein
MGFEVLFEKFLTYLIRNKIVPVNFEHMMQARIHSTQSTMHDLPVGQSTGIVNFAGKGVLALCPFCDGPSPPPSVAALSPALCGTMHHT